MAIATALKLDIDPDTTPLNVSDPDDSTLLTLIHKADEKAHVTIQFYDVMPSGPMYFFKNILLCGRFSAGASAICLPWSMIINDREYKDDLYDTLEAEFESVWNASYRYPGTWIEGRKSVFLSYSEQDRILAGEICERFRDKQIDCFMACHDLSPGEIWTDELRRKLCHSIEFVALLTPQSASSRWVLAELGAAWALGMNITPALVQVKVTDLPHFVGSRQAIDVSTTDGKQKLVDAVSERMLREFWTLRCAQGPTVTEI